MTEFVQRTLAELRTNESVNSEPLVNMLVESVSKSIVLGENIVSIYSNLKNGIISINKSIQNPVLESILDSFTRNEETPDLKIYSIAKEVDLTSKINKIKESNAYLNPLVKTKVDSFEVNLNTGTPDFALSESFINSLESYNYDNIIKESIEEVKKYVLENRSKLSILSAIYQMDSMKSPIYAGVSSDLKNMLITESYSADIIKLKYGTSIPLVSSLVNELRLIESSINGSFTLGEGNYDTTVNDLIAPAIKTKDGIIICTDNRFLSIREAKGLAGNESKVHIDSKFKITDVDPNYVKTNYGSFYELCEAYFTLGFNRTEDGLGVESKAVRGVTLALKINEKRELELYANGVKVQNQEIANISEALSLESREVRTRVQKIFEGTDHVYSFEFIKEISNSRKMADSLIFKLEESYFICDKVNIADRVWTEVNGNQLYEFFKHKFNYDISLIFKTEIKKEEDKFKAIEENKANLLVNITKLEESIEKLKTACENPELDKASLTKLETIKESIEKTILNLRQEYVRVDLLKKKKIA